MSVLIGRHRIKCVGSSKTCCWAASFAWASEAPDYYVRPQTFTIAADLSKADNEVQPDSRRPLRGSDFKGTICQAREMARKVGTAMRLVTA
jgi:hypothetical protein